MSRKTDGRKKLRVHATITEPDFPVTAATVRRWARAVLIGEGITGQVGIRMVSPHAMARWNRKLFGHKGATDVIAIPYQEGTPVPDPTGWFGEVLTSFGVARRQARHYGTTPRNELRRYLIHGLLHLAGYDHINCTESVARRMRNREDYYLEARKES